MPELTVIIPCYDEAERLGPFFQLIRDNAALDWEWLFVNDGSTDDTAARIDGLARDLPDQVQLHTLPKNSGKGCAVRTGMLEAKGNLVGFVDADLAADPLDFRPFLSDSAIKDGKELLIGIRLKTHDDKVKRYLYRHLMGRIFQTLVSNLAGLSCYDSQCGFKLMSRETARRLAADMKCDGFCFDVELLALADRNGIGIREEPIRWTEQGNSRIRISHIFEMFLDILRIRRRIKALKNAD